MLIRKWTITNNNSFAKQLQIEFSNQFTQYCVILVLLNGKITQFDSCDALAAVAAGKVFAVKNTDCLECRFYSVGSVTIDGAEYEKIICSDKINAVKLEPTVEDGYICFIENLY